MHFHNSIHIEGSELAGATARAKSQDGYILKLFKDKPFVKATASQVYQGGIKHRYWTDKTPITSIRRSLTTLTKSGKLIKTGEQRKGPHGMPEYYFILNTNENA